MRVSWVIAALLVLALVASPVLASDDSEAADGQPKQVVFSTVARSMPSCTTRTGSTPRTTRGTTG